MGGSLFERLSPELRKDIYERALAHNEDIEIAKSGRTGTLTTTNKKHATGLLQVCRQFRDEAAGIFYSSNHFRFRDQETPYLSTSGVSDVADTMSKFASKIGAKNARYLHHITTQLNIFFNAIESTDDVFAVFEVTWDQLRRLHLIRRHLRSKRFACDVQVSWSLAGHQATHTICLDLCDFETSRKTALEQVRTTMGGLGGPLSCYHLMRSCRYLLEHCPKEGLGETAIH